MLLIDEPDAHLEILRQKQIYARTRTRVRDPDRTRVRGPDRPAPAPAPAAAAPAPAPPWPTPPGWRTEVIPFPLDFAPTIAHRGEEELRFPPGFFDPASGDHWSYTFVWRTEDPAQLDATTLGAELTAYFRGLIAAVDKQQRIQARDQILARATPDGPTTFRLHAHVFDAFKTAAPI